MADQTKLMLSARELQFALDTEWVLTKRRITDAVYALFNEQVPVITQCFAMGFVSQDPILSAAHPKISKGENYRLLPYVMLDYPAMFVKDNVFAVRTMFWWGNFVSITLHVSGAYANALRARMLDRIGDGSFGFYVCVNDAEWEHHFEPANYQRAAGMGTGHIRNIVMTSTFIKLALKYDLTEWEKLPGLLAEGYKKIARLIAD